MARKLLHIAHMTSIRLAMAHILILTLACGAEEADTTATEALLGDVPVHEGTARELTGFRVEHVRFGEGTDCPAGCIYDDLCTVVVDGEAHLLSAAWFASAPEVVTERCNDMWFRADTRGCDTPGLALLTEAQIAELQELLREAPFDRCHVPVHEDVVCCERTESTCPTGGVRGGSAESEASCGAIRSLGFDGEFILRRDANGCEYWTEGYLCESGVMCCMTDER